MYSLELAHRELDKKTSRDIVMHFKKSKAPLAA
jgi:hypothetical protein